MGRVEGKAIATVKHKSFQGVPLLVVQPLDIKGADDGEPLIVIDRFGASKGDRVIISSDGAGARKLLNDRTSPVRWMVLGIADAGGA